MDVLNQFDDSMLENETIEQEESNDWEPLSVSQETNEETTEESETTEEVENQEESVSVDYSDNGLYSYLQSRGISDPSKIKFVDEDGNESEADFASLSPEEQASILEEVSNPGISDYEYNVINYLRQNNMSLEQVIDYFSQQRLEQYLNENPDKVHQQVYTIDDYTDDELYIADLKSKYPSFEDEELLEMLNNAKENEALFNKSVTTLRETYKAQEDQERAAAEQREAQQVEDLRTNLINAADSFNEIALDYTDPKSDSLVIEDGDKQQMISYLLDQDSEGKSQFVKDIENPDTLIELAWLRTKGAETLSGITQYYKDLLAQERKENKKLQEKITKMSSKTEPKSVVVPKDPTKKNNNNTSNYFDSMLD